MIQNVKIVSSLNMKNLVFITYLFILLPSFASVYGWAEQGDIRGNIDSAILSELTKHYGNDGTLNGSNLRDLINEVVGPNINERNVVENSTAAEEIIEACSTENLTSCKDAIANQCLDSSTLADIYAEEESGDWKGIFPALVYSRINNACLDTEEHNHKEEHEKPSSATAWGYGLGFAFLVIFISNIGGCMVPFRKRQFFHRMLMFCVALAVGTLAGTGFMVLIPESMQLTGDDSPVPDYHFKLATALGGIYFFYMSERLLKLFMRRNKKQKDKEIKLTKPKDGTVPMLENGGHSHFGVDDDADFTTLAIKEKDEHGGEVNPVAWLVITGDALHNFVDGMAIGAAFTENVYTGISVSLAVLCEELPHELGDIAILHHAGLSMKKALLYNFFAALTVLIGLVVGILLGENTEANTWIFAGAGGMFIYISLVDILPEMSEQASRTEERGIETPLTSFIIQNVGLVLGFCIIFILAMFGKYIQV